MSVALGHHSIRVIEKSLQIVERATVHHVVTGIGVAKMSKFRNSRTHRRLGSLI